ncbi:N-acetylglucosaminyldiphosphoundecaprenol N-acetyl-beta-D-mannosaminyltransferase [Geodermatophilus tzadiensis]|uniref:N-acetylglucosaminyldiphosphoundecaprenol N-acetyl-beta-D-mannosaminyltransferase n=1 Tax=Geodermatophilus tzadiensis TaxID=1137988 RepID=A0A2T0ST54_9ACTN|nr:WecB/TagA/CpsF family glycosyltransferase [Geodermatophilus tzadiensis]PRY36586.1 N-acetylglucosaminyldiphosphoundecaprenol N-acetyl-beta-D-mannosaminyltransferase [Geodermatophilus tzadiensis]
MGYFDVSLMTPRAAYETVLRWGAAGQSARLVVTPNLSMYSVWERHPDFRRACARANLVLADGWPIAVVGSIAARRVVPRVTGSDLLKNLVAGAAEGQVRIGIIGGQGPAEAVRRCRLTHPGVDMRVIDDAYHESLSESLAEHLARRAHQEGVDILVLAYGAPRQEVFGMRLARHLPHGVILCLGGAVDFLSGHQRRAPVIVRRLCLEGIWRMALDPRRVLPRYVLPAGAFARSLVEQTRPRWLSSKPA